MILYVTAEKLDLVIFFKQKTAYEMRISDWSSDVCSSDLLNATAMFNHSNVRIPAGFDRILRLIVVTPDMHRVHHSIQPSETNSNFGFNSPWWDRLLGTYRARPRDGHEGMTIGIEQFRNRRDQIGRAHV